jgi:cell division protein FtsN
MSADPIEESPRERRARIFVRQRRRRRLLFAALGLVALGALTALWVGYRSLSRGPATAEIPLIRADDQPTRKRPSEPGGMAVPDQDSLVLNHGQPQVEKLLPPPETPLPRPVPAERVEPPPATVTPAPRPATEAAPIPPPSVTAPPAARAPAPPPSPPPAAERNPSVAALPPGAVSPPAAAPAGHGYRLQLGAVRTPEAAKQEWERLRKANQDMLGGLGFAPLRVDLAGRGIFYRIQAGPLADAATAERTCNELKRRGVGCLLVKP